MEVKGKRACIMTPSGEFEKVIISNNEPGVGEIYTGQVFKKNSNIKYFVSAASVFLCVVLAGSSYAYYKPVNSLVVKINDTDTKIQINKFNKIINVSTIKKESDSVVKSLKLKHKDINDGLTKIVESSKGTNNNLFVEIKTNTKIESKLDIEKFKETMQKESIDYIINKKAKEDKKVKYEKEVKVKNTLNIKSETNKVNQEKAVKVIEEKIIKIDEEKATKINNAKKILEEKDLQDFIKNNKKENIEAIIKNTIKDEAAKNNIKNSIIDKIKENNKKDTQ
jgi:Anti-sigma factor N-terminus